MRNISVEQEQRYWRRAWSRRPWRDPERDFDYYDPALRYGIESAVQHASNAFDEIEGRLASAWPRYSGPEAASWREIREGQCATPSIDRPGAKS